MSLNLSIHNMLSDDVFLGLEVLEYFYTNFNLLYQSKWSILFFK